jgi:hypothetical protein
VLYDGHKSSSSSEPAVEEQTGQVPQEGFGSTEKEWGRIP